MHSPSFRVVLVTCISSLLAGRAVPAESPAPGVPETVRLEHREVWTPHPAASPATSLAGDEVLIQGNGTPTCCGGWQFVYTGIRGGQAYRIRADVEHKSLEHPRDSLVAMVLWDRWEKHQSEPGQKPWNYLLPKPASDHRMDFEAVVAAPEGATAMTVRYTFRWSTGGSSRWTAPQILPAAVPERKPVKICVLSNTRQTAQRIRVLPFSERLDLPKDVAECVDLWASLVLEACRSRPQLIVTPEVAIRGEDLIKGAVAVPGPATEPFEKIARENAVYLVLGMKQRDGDAVYNTAVLVGPEGVLGVYRKVHLATGEGLSGMSAGDSFPVFDTPIGRIGCLICMDTTVSESARMLALNGADFICFPIMGDLRADRWSPGPPIYHEDRWKAIMRTRAIDNQVCMVVARNGAQGSCIIDRKGDILAWNEGDREMIEATLPAEDGYRIWNGGDFREVTFLLRRPHLYGAYTDESSLKSLEDPTADPAASSALAKP